MRLPTALSGFASALVLFAAAGLPSAGLAQSETAAAKPPPPPWAGDIRTRQRLLGDPGGVRSGLAEYGIDIDFRLSQYYQAVVSGGVDKNGEYGGTMDYRLNVDAHKLGLWQGLGFNMHARTRFGDDVTADAGDLALQNTGTLMPAPGDYHGTDLTGIMVSQTFPLFEGRLGVVTAGKIDVIDTVTGFFPHVGYGQEGFWNVNAMVSAMPWFGAVQGLSLYGVIGMTVNEKYQTAESGFIATGTEGISTEQFPSISDSFDDGVWLAAFHRFFWDLDDKMGYFMIFGGYSTREQASNDPHDIVIIPGQGIEDDEKNPWDIALYLYQDFWQAKNNPQRKATVFLGGTVGPDDPQFAQWNIFGSVEAFGPMASRPHDRMGVSGWYNGLSGNFKDLVSPVADLRDIWGVEAYYNFEVVPSVHLSADLQLVKNARKGDDLAVIPGARLVIDF